MPVTVRDVVVDAESVVVTDDVPVREADSVTVTVAVADVVVVTVALAVEEVVTVAVAVVVGVGDALGESCKQYTVEVSLPNQRLPSAPIAAEAEMELAGELYGVHFVPPDDVNAYM